MTSSAAATFFRLSRQRSPLSIPIHRRLSSNVIPSSSKSSSQSPTNPSQPSQIARVTRSGTMSKTVRATTQQQVFDKHLRKHYTRPIHFFVHDPNEVLVEGDVIRFTRREKEGEEKGWHQQQLEEAKEREVKAAQRQKDGGDNKEKKGGNIGKAGSGMERTKKKSNVKYVLTEVVTPFGQAVEERIARKGEVVVNT